MTWRRAMRSALYGPGGFYARGERPARHFRTSVRASPRYAAAMLTLLTAVDEALGRPPQVDVVDVGAGGGELLGQLLAAVPAALGERLAAHAVEITPRPAGLDPRIRWRQAPPRRITGLVIASEWLDNVPLDVAEQTPRGPRLVLVDRATGAERPGGPPSPADLAWLAAWWPPAPGGRAEIGRPRCEAWAGLVARLTRGLAVAADYGHRQADRPRHGTLTGYLEGRQVPPVPDGSRDITAHVALDACARAGRGAGATATLLSSQRRVLRALRIEGGRPPLALADRDPAGYLAALCLASQEAELIDPAGLGGFGWLVQAAGIPLPPPLAALARQERAA
ncbi:MAG TPA: SAM-dependent methyltransferase [Streptosporangiaceae bacterium]|nr:SAM-dependent methyltransferase [Streptosporangiaceae bacterium]